VKLAQSNIALVSLHPKSEKRKKKLTHIQAKKKNKKPYPNLQGNTFFFVNGPCLFFSIVSFMNSENTKSCSFQKVRPGEKTSPISPGRKNIAQSLFCENRGENPNFSDFF
jgi:hypothetical protein